MMNTKSHFTCAWDIRCGDIVTHYNPEDGEPTTFEVTALLPTPSTAFVMMDTTIGLIQTLAGTPVEIFDGFDL